MTFWGPFKKNYLPQLSIWGHDESKISNETLVKLNHVIENLNVLGDFLGQHITIAKNLLGSNNLPSFDTMYFKMTHEHTKNKHISRLRLISYPLHSSQNINATCPIGFLITEHVEIIQE